MSSSRTPKPRGGGRDRSRLWGPGWRRWRRAQSRTGQPSVPFWVDELKLNVLWNSSLETDHRCLAEPMGSQATLIGSVNLKPITMGRPNEVHRGATQVLELHHGLVGHALSAPNIAFDSPAKNDNALRAAAVDFASREAQ